MTRKSPAFLLCLTLLLSGCSFLQSRESYADANELFNLTVSRLLAERGESISEDEWQEEVLPLINLADSLLDAYGVATRAGRDGEFALSELSNVLQALQKYLVETRSNAS